MREVKADLHVHTCLSPCASLEMTPQKIVQKARDSHIDLIAVSDHNSAENVRAVQQASTGKGVCVLAGLEAIHMEIRWGEIWCENSGQALSMQELIYGHLPPDENDEEQFGLQVVANEQDEVEATNPRLLVGATDLSVSEVVDAIHDRGGIAIASHVDREAFGIVGQLGFIPPDLEIDGIEVSRTPPDQAAQDFKDLALPVIAASDAHHLDEMGLRTTVFLIEDCTLSEIKMALKSISGRRVVSGSA